MKQKWHILLILCFFFVFFGCNDFEEVKVKGVEGFKIEKLSMAGIEAEVMIGIQNPNNMGFTVYPSEFDIIIGGINLGKARLYKKVKIDAGCQKAYPFKLKSDFKGINLMELTSIIGGKLAGNIEVKGNLYAGKFLIKKKYPVDVKEKFNLPRFN